MLFARQLPRRHRFVVAGSGVCGAVVALILLAGCGVAAGAPTTGTAAQGATSPEATNTPFTHKYPTATATPPPASTATPPPTPTAVPNPDPLSFVASQGNLYGVDQKNGAIVWRYTGVDVNIAPTVSSTAIYTVNASQTSIVALAPATGAVRWSQQATSSIAGVTLQNGVIAVNTPNSMTAYDAVTGAVLWTQTPTWNLSATAVADGIVFLTGTDAQNVSYLLALSIASGARKWMLTVPSPPKTPGTAGPLFVDRGAVFDVLADGKLYALKEANGATIWAGDQGIFPFGIANGTIFTASRCNISVGIIFINWTGYCYNGFAESNGAPLWSFQYTESACFLFIFGCGPPTLPTWYAANGTIAMLYDTSVVKPPNASRQIISILSTASGADLWDDLFPVAAPAYNGAPATSPPTVDSLVGNGSILYYETSDGIISQLDTAHHRKTWSATIPAGGTGTLSLVAGDLYALTTQGVLYALNAQTGAKLWSTPLT